MKPPPKPANRGKSPASGKLAKPKVKNPKPKIRVLLVDDQIMLLDVLKRQFEEDPSFEVVAAASTLTSALDAAEEHAPDVVLLDIEIGEESGLDAVPCIRVMLPEARIIMLSMFDREVYRDRAFELGADAYATKGVRFDALRAFLLDPAAPLPEASRSRIWRRPRTGSSARLTLTERELQVVRALARGQREKEVAEALEIGVSSVGTYLNRAMLKSGMTTRAELFRYAGSLGVETMDEI